MVMLRLQARWVGSRLRCRQLRTIALRWLTCQGNGSTGFTNASRPSGSRWTWTVQSAPPTVHRKARRGTAISAARAPAVRVQSIRPSGTLHAACRQCAQRRWMGRGSEAGHGAIRGSSPDAVLPRWFSKRTRNLNFGIFDARGIIEFVGHLPSLASEKTVEIPRPDDPRNKGRFIEGL
jgi:hypothetical protein